jgi:hypothetical protein
MSSLPQVAQALRHVLTEVPTALARESGFCQRQSKLTAALFVQTVVLGWLAQPTGTLHQLTQTAADCGVSLSPQGLAQRFTPAAAALLRGVLEAAVQQVIVAEPVAVGPLARFPAVVLMDSTTVALPDGLASVWAGCGGRVEQGGRAALKLTVRLDLCGGRLDGPLLSDGRAQDKATPLQQAPLPRGALRIADLGFWSLDVLGEIAAQEAYFLSRLHLQTAVFAADGERLDLVASYTPDKLQRMVTTVYSRLRSQGQARPALPRIEPPRPDGERARLERALRVAQAELGGAEANRSVTTALERMASCERALAALGDAGLLPA